MRFIYGTGEDKLTVCYEILELKLRQLPKDQFNFERDNDGHLISYTMDQARTGRFSQKQE